MFVTSPPTASASQFRLEFVPYLALFMAVYVVGSAVVAAVGSAVAAEAAVVVVTVAMVVVFLRPAVTASSAVVFVVFVSEPVVVSLKTAWMLNVEVVDW